MRLRQQQESALEARKTGRIVTDSKGTAMTLYQAAKAGDVEAIRELLASGADIDEIEKGRPTLFGLAEDSGTALMAAAAAGHREAVRVLLDAGANYRLKDENEADALLHAIAPGHAEIVNLLLEAGANPKVKGPERRSALSIAAWAGHEPVVRALLVRGADVTAGDASWVTPLHYAVRQRHLSVAQLLIEAGAPVNVRDRQGSTPLHDASQKLFLISAVNEAEETPVHLGLVRLLLGAGAEVDTRDGNGWTPLHRAVMDDRIEIARQLIRKGADVNSRAGNGSYPLMRACDNLEMTEMLLQAGAKVDAVDEDKESALFYAVNGESEPVIRALVAAGADINHRGRGKRTVLDGPADEGNASLYDLLVSLGAVDEGRKRTRKMGAVSLRKAAEEGDLKRVQELLAAGIPVDGREEYDGTALWKAAEKGHLEIVRLLLAAGADANLPGQYESRALHRAASTGSLDLVKALLDAGADVNVAYDREWGEGFEGWTPLMEAAESGSLEIVRALVQAGADVNAKTRNGYTALLLAALEQEREIAAALQAAGAKSGGVAGHFLETLIFSDRLDTPEIAGAIADFSAICSVPVTFAEDLPGVALFDVAASPAYAQTKAAVAAEMASKLLATKQFAIEAEAREASESMAGYQAAAEIIHGLVERHQTAFLERGCYLVELTGFMKEMVALLPTTNLYAVVARLGPGPRGIPRMLRWLEKLHAEYPFRLRGAGGATLQLQFVGEITDRDGLAKKLFRAGADECGPVVNGQGSVLDTRDELSAALAAPNPVARLWWD